MPTKIDIVKAYKYLNKSVNLGVTNFEQMNKFFRDNYDVCSKIFIDIRKPPAEMNSRKEIENLHDAYLTEL
jgi:hypothetical protein